MCHTHPYFIVHVLHYIICNTIHHVSIIRGVFILLLTYLLWSGWGQSIETPAWVCNPNATPGPQAKPSQTSFYLYNYVSYTSLYHSIMFYYMLYNTHAFHYPRCIYTTTNLPALVRVWSEYRDHWGSIIHIPTSYHMLHYNYIILFLHM